MSTWIAVLGVGLGSYLLRSVPLLAARGGRPHPRLEHAVRHAGLAAVTSLVVVPLRHHADAVGTTGGLTAVVAVAVAALLARRGRSMLTGLVAGAACYAASSLAL